MTAQCLFKKNTVSFTFQSTMDMTVNLRLNMYKSHLKPCAEPECYYHIFIELAPDIKYT